MEVGLSLVGDVASFGSSERLALATSLKNELACHEPSCFLTLRISAGSIQVAAILAIPNAPADVAAAVEAAAIALVALPISNISARLNVTVDTVSQTAVGQAIIPLVVAPPPPPSQPPLSSPPPAQASDDGSFMFGLRLSVIIIIASAGGGVLLLLVTIMVCCYCCCVRSKAPPPLENEVQLTRSTLQLKVPGGSTGDMARLSGGPMVALDIGRMSQGPPPPPPMGSPRSSPSLSKKGSKPKMMDNSVALARAKGPAGRRRTKHQQPVQNIDEPAPPPPQEPLAQLNPDRVLPSLAVDTMRHAMQTARI